MKKFVVMMAAVLMTAVASVAMAEDKVTGDVYVSPASKYVWRGYDLSEAEGLSRVAWMSVTRISP